MRTLLLAENHLPTLRHLAELLTEAGFDVRSASEASEAMALFAAAPPDAVVVSLDFPALASVPVSVAIRGMDAGLRVPIVVVDHGHLKKPRGVQSILGLKANAYIADPVRGNELTSKVLALIAATQPVAVEDPPQVAAVLAQPPVAGGELRSLNLPLVAEQLQRSRRSGVLVVAHKGVTRRLFVLRGTLAAFDSSLASESFLQHLLDQGLISRAQAQTVLEATLAGFRILTALGEAGLELPLESLREKLAEYTFENARDVFGMREGKYTFHEGGGFEGGVALVQLPLLAALFAGARSSFPLRAMVQLLQPYFAQFPSRNARFASELPALALSPVDLKIAMQVNGRIQLRDILAHGRGDVRLNTSLLWLLTLTGTVTYESKPQAMGPSQHTPPPDTLGPRKKKGLPPETVAELRDAAVKIITGSYFNVLGVSICAPAPAIERAYQETAVRFHPDSYAEYDASELQDLLEAVQDKLAAAFRVLSVDERRRAYLEHLLGKVGGARVAEPHVEAEVLLRRGDEALRRSEFSVALRSYDEAIELNPREPEYYPRLAWAVLRGGEGMPADRAKVAQRHLKRALSLNPGLERAHVILAILENESGQAPAARKRLVQILSQNPTSVLARAALRRVGR